MMNRITKFFGSLTLLLIIFLASSFFLESCKGKGEGDTVYEEEEGSGYGSDEEIYEEFFESDEEASRAGVEVDDVGDSQVDPEYQAVEQDQSDYVDDFSFEASEDEVEAIKAEKTPTQTARPKRSQESEPAKYKAPSSAGGSYLVVAGSYLIKDNAQKMVDKLAKLGYSGAEIVNFDESKYHSITAGRYNSYDAASEVAGQLKNKGIDCYVHTRK